MKLRRLKQEIHLTVLKDTFITFYKLYKPGSAMTKTYKYSELGLAAKKKIVVAYLTYLEDHWREPILEEFRAICLCLGFVVREIITFEGDRFPVGTVNFEPEACDKIGKLCPEDEELYRIAEELTRMQAQLKMSIGFFAKLRVNLAFHTYDTEVFPGSDAVYEYVMAEWDRSVNHLPFDEPIWALKEWLNRTLRKEYQRVTSDAAISEYCDWNEMKFTFGGRLCV